MNAKPSQAVRSGRVGGMAFTGAPEVSEWVKGPFGIVKRVHGAIWDG